MCEGPIVEPAGKKTVEKQNFLKKTIKKFVEKIIGRGSFVLLNKSPVVNVCLKCGDLKIDNKWQRIPYPHITSIKNAIMTGGILVNGDFKICDFCASAEKEREEKRIYSAFEQVSTMSF
jgi:hypothetical protein